MNKSFVYTLIDKYKNVIIYITPNLIIRRIIILRENVIFGIFKNKN